MSAGGLPAQRNELRDDVSLHTAAAAAGSDHAAETAPPQGSDVQHQQVAVQASPCTAEGFVSRLVVSGLEGTLALSLMGTCLHLDNIVYDTHPDTH